MKYKYGDSVRLGRQSLDNPTISDIEDRDKLIGTVENGRFDSKSSIYMVRFWRPGPGDWRAYGYWREVDESDIEPLPHDEG